MEVLQACLTDTVPQFGAAAFRGNYHYPIPWYIWVLALIAQFVAFGEPAMRSAVGGRWIL